MTGPAVPCHVMLCRAVRVVLRRAVPCCSALRRAVLCCSGLGCGCKPPTKQWWYHPFMPGQQYCLSAPVASVFVTHLLVSQCIQLQVINAGQYHRPERALTA